MRNILKDSFVFLLSILFLGTISSCEKKKESYKGSIWGEPDSETNKKIGRYASRGDLEEDWDGITHIYGTETKYTGKIRHYGYSQEKKLEWEGSYKDGVMHGRWTWYLSNGDKNIDGYMRNNKPIGEWKVMYSSSERRINKEVFNSRSELRRELNDWGNYPYNFPKIKGRN